MGLEYYRDQWIWLLSISDMYESTSIESGKLPFKKKGWTTIPIRNVFVGVYTHINKKIIKDVSNSTGIVNSFSTF